MDDINEGDVWEDGEPVTPLDMKEANALPPGFETTVSLIPKDGKTVFHLHPDRDDIFEVIAMACLDGRMFEGKSTNWVEFAGALNDEFPGLNCSNVQLRDFCLRQVAPAVVIPKSSALRSIIDKGQSLDVLGKLMATSDAAHTGIAKAIETLQRFEQGEDGRLTRTGASVSELAAILRAASHIDNKVIDELERYGIVPEKKKAPENQTNVQVNVDMAAAMRHAQGN